MPDTAGFVASLRNHPKSPVAAWVTIAVVCVAGFEGFAAKPSVDTVGTGRPITWCYGRTGADGPIPAMTMVFTKAQCQDELGQDLQKYDAMVHACITVPMSPHQEAAFVSFVYNGGQGWLCNPHKKTYAPVAKDFNAGHLQAACDAMLGYNHAQGKVLLGLTRRRQAERAMCLEAT